MKIIIRQVYSKEPKDLTLTMVGTGKYTTAQIDQMTNELTDAHILDALEEHLQINGSYGQMHLIETTFEVKGDED